MSPRALTLLADGLVAFHLGFVLFVLVGELLIVLGALLRWSWIRNLAFRLAHLAAIVVVASEALLGWVCPLTRWEWELREAAGHDVEHVSFVGRIARGLLYWDLSASTFTVIYVAFAALVVATLVLVPPRRRALRASVAPVAPTSNGSGDPPPA